MFLVKYKARTSRVLVLKLFECIIQLMLSRIEMQRDIITCYRVIIGYSEYCGRPNRRWKLGLSEKGWFPLIRSPWWPGARHLSSKQHPQSSKILGSHFNVVWKICKVFTAKCSVPSFLGAKFILFWQWSGEKHEMEAGSFGMYLKEMLPCSCILHSHKINHCTFSEGKRWASNFNSGVHSDKIILNRPVIYLFNKFLAFSLMNWRGKTIAVCFLH